MNKTEIEAKLVNKIQLVMEQPCFTASQIRDGAVKSWAVIGSKNVTMTVRPNKKHGHRIRVYWEGGNDHSYFSKQGKNLEKTARKIIRAVLTNNGWSLGAMSGL